MKSSALALATAAALMFGATSVSFAQDASTTTAPTSAEECLELQAAGSTAPDESLVNEQEDDNSAETATGTESDSTDAAGAIDDTTPADCPVVNESEGQ
ncbi:hypothetical protein [Devosia submarina]|uniref:hypothetical protein n=1 Tax=Devosia submarina TaxID=1173082 RepID=UPI000D365697|nr:hypothetical protein [Devosia submarina]